MIVFMMFMNWRDMNRWPVVSPHFSFISPSIMSTRPVTIIGWHTMFLFADISKCSSSSGDVAVCIYQKVLVTMVWLLRSAAAQHNTHTRACVTYRVTSPILQV